METWKPVVGWSDYEVSDHGRVRSTKRGATRLLKPVMNSGYLRVDFCQGGKRRTGKIHNLVLEAFVGKRPARSIGAHNDGDTSNNRLSNLRYATPKQNAEDRERHGRTAKGIRAGTVVLSEAEACAIASLAGTYNQIELATAFDISRGAVRAIHSGRSWRHLFL